MDADNTYYPYSGADILRYLDGRMTNQEMRRLELAAMDDPFLEDAIDGYREAYAKNQTNKIIPALREIESYNGTTQNEKETAKPIIPIWRNKLFQYAAAAVLVLGTGWYILSLNYSNSPFENKAKEQSTVSAATDSVSVVSTNKDFAKSEYKKSAHSDTFYNADGNQSLGLVSTENKPLPSAAPSLPATLSANKPLADISATDSNNTSSIASAYQLTKAEATTEKAAKEAKGLDNYDTTVVIPMTAARKRNRLVDKQHLEDTKLQKISGKVVDGEKYPLDNITLRLKGMSGTTLSDELGRFEMVLPDTNATLIASGPGYKTKEFKVAGLNQRTELQLEPERSLEEEVVAGYMNSKKKTLSNANAKNAVLEMDTTEASPVGGWDNFIKYVKQNKRFKDRPGSLSIAVVINFEVDEEGRLGEFEIKKSGGDAYDKEAIRLLKEGPPWKIKLEDEEIGAVKITLVL